MKMDTLFSIDTDSQQTDGMELLQIWRFYHRNEYGQIMEDIGHAGFSFPNAKKITDLEKNFLLLAKEQIVKEMKLSGKNGKISFWGTDSELTNYLEFIQKKIGISENIFFVNIRYTLLHKKEEHQHFADIYF